MNIEELRNMLASGAATLTIPRGMIVTAIGQYDGLRAALAGAQDDIEELTFCEECGEGCVKMPDNNCYPPRYCHTCQQKLVSEIVELKARLTETELRAQVSERRETDEVRLYSQCAATLDKVEAERNAALAEVFSLEGRLAEADLIIAAIREAAADKDAKYAELIDYLAEANADRGRLHDALKGELVSLHKWNGHGWDDVMTCPLCLESEWHTRMIKALKPVKNMAST